MIKNGSLKATAKKLNLISFKLKKIMVKFSSKENFSENSANYTTTKGSELTRSTIFKGSKGRTRKLVQMVASS